MKRPPVTMPSWPAWMMGAFAAACAYPAITMPPPEADTYAAAGRRPGWTLTMAGDRLQFADRAGIRIAAARPRPRVTAAGRRYETPRLTVEIAFGRCVEPASGHAFAHRVTVVADGRKLTGCGGLPRSGLDA